VKGDTVDSSRVLGVGKSHNAIRRELLAGRMNCWVFNCGMVDYFRHFDHHKVKRRWDQIRAHDGVHSFAERTMTMAFVVGIIANFGHFVVG
jgi:hypothetical protein